MLEGRRMIRIALNPTGCPKFCHKFCPALSGEGKFKNRVISNFSRQIFTGGSKHDKTFTLNYVRKANLF